jgi:cytochrome c5
MLIRVLAAILCATAVTACGQSAQPSAATPATDTPHAAATPASAATDTSGADVYNKTCALCHGSGAGGAPMFGVHADWEARIAQGSDTLYRHAIEGFTGEKGVMPPKGANAGLSDDEVKAAVDYMQAQAQ